MKRFDSVFSEYLRGGLGAATFICSVCLLLLFQCQPNKAKASDLLEEARQAETDGEYARAVDKYTSAMRLSPRSAKLHVLRAVALSKLGDTSACIEDLTHAISLSPECGHCYFLRGVILAERGRTEGAIADMTNAIANDTLDVDAYNLRGDLRLMSGDTVGACKDYRQSLVIRPELNRAERTISTLTCK